MKKIIIFLIAFCFIILSAGCMGGTEDKTENKETEINNDIKIITDLKDNMAVTSPEFNFKFCAKGKKTDITVSVSAVLSVVTDLNDGNYTTTLIAGENVIITKVNCGDKIIENEYKIIYNKKDAPEMTVSITNRVIRNDRFGFYVNATDKDNKSISPEFKWIDGTPSGTPMLPNGKIDISLIIDNTILTKNNDIDEKVDKYSDGTPVKDIFYVAWADSGTKNVYYKANLPDELKVFSGYIKITVMDTNENQYSVFVKVNYEYSNNPDKEAGRVTFSVEIFTIGGGYIIEPVEIPYRPTDNNASLVLRVLNENGFKASYTGSDKSGFYLSAIHNGDETNVSDKENLNKIPENVQPNHLTVPSFAPDFPECLIDAMVTTNAISGVEDLYGQNVYGSYIDETGAECLSGLGEFDYYYTSGWMYSVNGKFPGVGASSTTPNDGDVIRWQFTLYGYGSDLGGAINHTENIFSCNKDELTKAVAKIKSEDNQENYGINYKNAVELLKRLDATQKEVDNILGLLR